MFCVLFQNLLITFSSPSWRFQIQQENNQQIVLSHWLQGQRLQANNMNQSQQQEEVSSVTSSPNPSDTAVNMSPGADDHVWTNPVPQPTEEQLNTSPPQPSPSTNNTPNNPFSAISLFLEQNPEIYGFLKTLLAYIPFLILVLIKEIYKHTSGIQINFK